MPRQKFEDEEEMYIPDSNAGIALDWSPLEQQMFDLLFLNRVGTYERDVVGEMANTVAKLISTFKPHELARISAVVMLALQLKVTEDKDFGEELERYFDYIKSHPEDIEEI